MRLLVASLFALAIGLPAAESTTVTDTTITTSGSDRPTVTTQIHDQLQAQTEKTGDKGRVITWTRDTAANRSDGASAERRAEGTAVVKGDGSGTVEIERQGRATSPEGKTRSWTEKVDGSWERNAQGGRDSERTLTHTDDKGRTSTADSERHSEQRGNQKAFREETDVRTWRGDTFSLWETGHQVRIEKKDGFVVERELKGNNRTNEKWNRHEREEVTRKADGSREVKIVAHIKRPGQHPRIETTRGTWSPLTDQRGWQYIATVEVEEGSKVVESRRIEQTHRRNPVDAADYGRDGSH